MRIISKKCNLYLVDLRSSARFFIVKSENVKTHKFEIGNLPMPSLSNSDFDSTTAKNATSKTSTLAFIFRDQLSSLMSKLKLTQDPKKHTIYVRNLFCFLNTRANKLLTVTMLFHCVSSEITNRNAHYWGHHTNSMYCLFTKESSLRI